MLTDSEASEDMKRLTEMSDKMVAGWVAVRGMNTPQPLQLDYTPIGDRCIYCNADAYDCEHYDDSDWSQYADKETDAERNQ